MGLQFLIGLFRPVVCQPGVELLGQRGLILSAGQFRTFFRRGKSIFRSV